MDDTQLEPPTTSPPELTDWDIQRWSHFLGRTIIWLSSALILVWLLESSGNLPFRLPDFWYPVRQFWWIVGISGIVIGIKILNRHPRLAGWHPNRGGQRFHAVILYTRVGCHLCDEAKAVLEAYGRYLPPLSEVDIDKDAILIAKFTTCVPVVEIDGKIRFKGRVDEILLRRLIEGTSPSR